MVLKMVILPKTVITNIKKKGKENQPYEDSMPGIPARMNIKGGGMELLQEDIPNLSSPRS
jgi:hypothetical protein